MWYVTTLGVLWETNASSKTGNDKADMIIFTLALKLQRYLKTDD